MIVVDAIVRTAGIAVTTGAVIILAVMVIGPVINVVLTLVAV